MTNGKGDAPRITQDQEAYADSWDRIFAQEITCKTCGEKTADYNEDRECSRCVSIRNNGRDA